MQFEGRRMIKSKQSAAVTQPGHEAAVATSRMKWGYFAQTVQGREPTLPRHRSGRRIEYLSAPRSPARPHVIGSSI